MARSPKGAPVSTWLTRELLAKLDALVAERGGSRSDALRHLLEAYELSPFDEDVPLFDPPIPVDEDEPPASFKATRYGHVA